MPFYAGLILLALAGPAGPLAEHACDVSADVIDQDIHGTNVRDKPGGKIVATLPAPSGSDDWIEVHIAGVTGDWLLVDRAEMVGDSRKTIFRGKGYMHNSVLGSDGLVSGEAIRTGPNDLSAPVRRVDRAASVTLLGCEGAYLKVRVGTQIGWTKKLCLNQRTTCA